MQTGQSSNNGHCGSHCKTSCNNQTLQTQLEILLENFLLFLKSDIFRSPPAPEQVCWSWCWSASSWRSPSSSLSRSYLRDPMRVDQRYQHYQHSANKIPPVNVHSLTFLVDSGELDPKMICFPAPSLWKLWDFALVLRAFSWWDANTNKYTKRLVVRRCKYAELGWS